MTYNYLNELVQEANKDNRLQDIEDAIKLVDKAYKGIRLSLPHNYKTYIIAVKTIYDDLGK